MQNELYQSDPNLLSETYRNQSDLQIPRRIEKHFDFLEVSDDGLLLLGTSNLNGRIWSGSVWAFEDFFSDPRTENCLAGIEFESSIATGLWLNKKNVVVGCDSGTLHYLSLNIMTNKDKDYFTTDGILTEHDDSITSLSLMNNKTKIISCGMDMNIKVWNIETLSSEHSYCPAHGHIVTSVSAHIEDGETFVSTSLDCTTLLWDKRLEKPASLIIQNECGYTASTWIDDNCISLGSNDGSISLVDLRTRQELCTNFCSDRPIFKLKFNSELEMLAVCADDPNVRVFHIKDKYLEKKYDNNQHKDFIRGLSWHVPFDILYSCGWDSKIYSHNMKYLTGTDLKN